MGIHLNQVDLFGNMYLWGDFLNMYIKGSIFYFHHDFLLSKRNDLKKTSSA